MIGLVILAILGLVVWKLWTPGLTFVQGFASLLERPAGRSGLWPFLTGVETIGGQYQGRTVLLIVHHKRGRNTLGYLTVAMQPLVASDIIAKYSGGFREWISEPAARAAWDDLELRHELKLSFGEGWMRAMWQPSGFFIFPGRFEAERWGSVLQSMYTVVVSLERGSQIASRS
jgi:hypothetical protein